MRVRVCVLDCSVKMSGSSCSSSSSCKRSLDTDSTSGAPPPKRRILFAKSVEKWSTDHDKQLNTTTWLKYSVVARVHVECIKCSVSTKDKLSQRQQPVAMGLKKTLLN